MTASDKKCLRAYFSQILGVGGGPPRSSSFFPFQFTVLFALLDLFDLPTGPRKKGRYFSLVLFEDKRDCGAQGSWYLIQVNKGPRLGKTWFFRFSLPVFPGLSFYHLYRWTVMRVAFISSSARRRIKCCSDQVMGWAERQQNRLESRLFAGLNVLIQHRCV